MTQQLLSRPAAKVGQPYRSWKGRDDFDVVIVGSGIGALSAAALLAKRAGKRVLVLERHYTAGGYTHVFRRPGYEWDVGIHYVGEFHRPGSMLASLFDYVSDRGVAWEPMGDVYDRMIIGGQSFDYVAGPARFRDTMRQYFPGEAGAIDKYLDLVKATVRSMQLYYAEKVIPSPLAFLIGPALRWPFLRHARRTTLEVLQGLTNNKLLIGVLTGQWGDYGLPPAQSSFAMHAILAHHYLHGAAYPVGGASRIAAAIAPVIEAAGGQILVNAEVAGIVVEGNTAIGVEMSDGRVIRAKTVISGTGAINTFGRLLPEPVAERHGLRNKLRAVEPSHSYVNLYVGMRHSDRELGLEKTNLWIYSTPDHDKNVADYLADMNKPLPVAYISFPSAKDPEFQERFPTRSTIQVIGAARYDWFKQWEDERWQRRGEGYQDLKDRFKERLLETLYEHVPQVRGKVDHAEVSTPLSNRHFSNYGRGELYGLAHSPARFQERFLRPRTPVRNLFLTGQDITSCGVAGGLAAGVLCASAILNRNLLSAIVAEGRGKGAKRVEHVGAAGAGVG
jgi:all-trans-retinol 13,14-reductase